MKEIKNAIRHLCDEIVKSENKTDLANTIHTLCSADAYVRDLEVIPPNNKYTIISRDTVINFVTDINVPGTIYQIDLNSEEVIDVTALCLLDIVDEGGVLYIYKAD